MNDPKFVISLEKADIWVKPFTRIRRGRAERVSGYRRTGKEGFDIEIDFDKLTKEQRLQLATWNDIIMTMKEDLKRIRTGTSKAERVKSKLDDKKAEIVTENMKRVLRNYTGYLAGNTTDLVHRFIDQMRKVLISEDLKELSSEWIDELGRDMIRKLIWQEIQSNRNIFSDHGIRHIVNNALNQVKMLDLLKKHGFNVSEKEKLMAMFIMINHDIGYAAPLVREGSFSSRARGSKEHKDYSMKILNEQKELWNVDKIFSEKEYERILEIVRTHDMTELDLKDPVALTARIADNLALFHEEKLPSMFKYVEGSKSLLLMMMKAAAKNNEKLFETYRDKLWKKIDASNLSVQLKRDLKNAVKDITQVSPKFTVGALAGEISDITADKDSLITVKVKHNKWDEFLQQMFDMGQISVKKFLEDYGEKDFSKNEYKLGKYKDRAVLKLIIEGRG